jgi:class 3 adenylate cyclase/tetratricopeptide (TPR) repeat protein
VICSNCGTENEAGRKFCGECAARLAVVCPACGAPNPPTVKFCGECAALLVPDGGAATPARPSASAGPPVAERRLVSVLFADLVGFTSLADGKDAEAVRDLLSRYFELAREVVGRYGGTVEKFIGDAVMAVWGTPSAHEDDAERSVRAALELLDVIGTLGPGIQARAAVLTGEAAVTIGAQGQGMVAGDLVNTASRLQSAAPPGAVLVDEATRGAASAGIAFEPAGEQLLRGKSAPIPSFCALRVVAEVGGRGRADTLDPPFVGREEEMRLLKDLLHATGRERRPRLVSVTGVAGIGKSRLAWEFLKYVDGLVEDIYWHEGRSPAYGEGVTFWALGEMVRRRAGLAETDDERTTRARIAATLEEFVPDEGERRWIEPALLALLAVAEVPPGGHESLYAAWRVFFERVAAQGTTVLVFEDLQWADSGLLDFIDDVVEWSRDVPLLLVTLSRPELLERRPDWGSRGRAYTSLRLEPLSDAAMADLITGLVPELAERALREIVERADGMPLFAVETVRMLLADGRLVTRDGVIEPAGDLGTLGVPPSLHALIAARLDGLSAADRALLQDAAVVGHSFTPAALAAVSGVESHDLAPRLRDLVRREFLRLQADPRSPERGQYAFLQALVREVAYGTLARRDRKARHLAAARYLESLGDEEIAGALAAHYLSARDDAADDEEAATLAVQARVTLRGAARRAAALGSHAQALAYIDQALAITTEPREEADLREAAGLSASALTRFDDAEHHYARCEELRRILGDRPGAVRAITERARNRTHVAEPERARAILEPATAEFADLVDEPATVALGAELSRALMLVEDNRAAVAVAEGVLDRAERLNLVPVLADALVTKGSALVNLRRPREGKALIEAGWRLAQQSGLGLVSLRAAVNLSWAEQEDTRRSFAICQEALETARRLGQRSWELQLTLNSIDGAILLGDWDWAMAEVEAAIATEMAPVYLANFKGNRAVLCARRGDEWATDWDEAEQLIGANLEPQLMSAVESGCAEIAFATGDFEGAREHWLASIPLYPTFGSGAWWGAAQAALWDRDAGGAEQILAGLKASGERSFWEEQAGREIRAGLAALAGRTAEAVAGYRDALARWRDRGVHFLQALSALTFVHLVGPDNPDAQEAAEEARVIFERLRARPFLERLEETMAGRDARDASAAIGRSRAEEARANTPA